MPRSSSRVRSIARFFFLLALALWLGGLSLIAYVAPAMLNKAVAIAPGLGVAAEVAKPLIGRQMVGAAIGAFTPITFICAFLAFAGWLFERTSSTSPAYKLWRLQGVCVVTMLVAGLYSGFVVLPQMEKLQPAVVHSALSGRTDATRTQFQALHAKYGAASIAVLLFGLIALGSFASRGLNDEKDS